MWGSQGISACHLPAVNKPLSSATSGDATPAFSVLVDVLGIRSTVLVYDCHARTSSQEHRGCGFAVNVLAATPIGQTGIGDGPIALAEVPFNQDSDLLSLDMRHPYTFLPASPVWP